MGEQTERAQAALARLGRTVSGGAIALLSGGVSGAASYRVMLPEGVAVLKLMAATAAPEQRQCARRELSFYRELAPHLPLRTPELLAGAGGKGKEVVLLLRAYGPPRSLHELTAAELELVLAQQAAFHAATLGPEQCARYPWLRPAGPPPTAADLEQVVVVWQAQAAGEALRAVITPAILAALPGWGATLLRAERRLAGYPLTLVHGDCHLGNVLWAGDKPVWTDWQQVGLGAGPGEISFLLQRACGPQDDAAFAHWAERYATLLAEAAPAHPDPALTLQIIDLAELRLRLLQWPHYFDWLPPEAVAHQLLRTARVAERLEREGS